MMLVKKIKLKLKWAWNDFLGIFQSEIKWKAKLGEIRVLCLHGVCKDEDPYINGRFIKESQLRTLLTELKKHVHFLSTDQFENAETDPSKMNVFLTFDDGYLNNKTLLLPILEELQIPALFFVTGQCENLWMDLFDVADHAQLNLETIREEMNLPGASSKELKRKIIESKPEKVMTILKLLHEQVRPVYKDYKIYIDLLSDADLKELSENALIELGNHTKNHFNLCVLNEGEIASEIQNCEERIEHVFSNNKKRIAIPFALYNSTILECLNELGYSGVYINEPMGGIKENTTERFIINPFISTRNQLRAISDGKY